MPVTRESIIDCCVQALQPLSPVRAAFLGGSEAFGRADQWSDIDLVSVGPQDQADDVFAALEERLQALSPIVLKLVMPPSSLWPELSQRFYRLRDTDEFLMIDFCQVTPGQLTTFLEPARHGTPVVLFDHDGLIKPVPLESDHDERMHTRLAWHRAAFPMFQNLARKAVLRGDLVEAIAVYHSHTLRPLVDVLRMLHCPVRFDYGFRYTSYDLPAQVTANLRELMWPQDGQDLLAKLERAATLFSDTVVAIDAGGDER
ncbi:MAG: hypothetical protein IPK87_05260 [Planctomycetes bacterium]|nr:hypothetical protein [Planctomycetota bacterium]